MNNFNSTVGSIIPELIETKRCSGVSNAMSVFSTTDYPVLQEKSVSSVPPAVVIVLLCGLPGSGKSTILRELSKRFGDTDVCFLPLIFDDLLSAKLRETSSPWSPDAWRHARISLMKRCELLARAPLTLPESRDSGSKWVRKLILVEDNFQLRSMRRDFYIISRSCEFQINEIVLLYTQLASTTRSYLFRRVLVK